MIVAEFDMAITVDRDRRLSMNEIAAAVSEAGVTVERVLPAIGAIYGHADETCVPAIEAVSGVAGVRRSGTVQHPPFDPNVPQ